MSAQEDTWLFDFVAYGILFGNKDIGKVNGALEME